MAGYEVTFARHWSSSLHFVYVWVKHSPHLNSSWCFLAMCIYTALLQGSQAELKVIGHTAMTVRYFYCHLEAVG